MAREDIKCALTEPMLVEHFMDGVEDARRDQTVVPVWYMDNDRDLNPYQKAYAEGFTSVVRGEN
jgi:hypothetical protein